MRIREGTEADFERLRAIAVEAKAHWGYDRAQVEEWALGGDFEPESLRKRLLYVAEVDGRPVGWAALIPRGEVGWLEDLWVEPAWIGRGLGRALFEHVATEARQLGARQLEWEAEPNASGFYEHMGGAYVRDSEVTEWGRVLEVLAVELT
ncbi:MAG TPA: GNAT family N-acetyltransferase [Gaiellaceae bacterium]|nr:GNAT family N-acetyltransferase [Gaiellaceae bacterium]